MSKKIHVLVFPCGAENSVEIYYALKNVFNIKIFGASSRDDHGSYIFRNYIGDIPFISDDSFIAKLNGIIFEYNIDVIIPTHDDVVLKLAENEQKINAKIAIPGLRQSQLSRSKKATYKLFEDDSFCPITYDNLQLAKHNLPIFVKPDEGQGGKGSFKIDGSNFDQYVETDLSQYVICENLPGEELTVDCFTDRNGVLKFIGPRTRERVFGGISVRSTTIDLTEEIKQIAHTISNKVKMNGLWFFQIKKDYSDKFKLLEISVRTAGTMNLYRGLGVNFPLLTIYNLLNYDINIVQNKYRLQVDRALFNRYKSEIDYDTVYIDFDDTITLCPNKVNPEAMLFLYNIKQRNKRIILITRHEYDIDDTLERLSIHKGLFNEIIHLKKDERKCDYIKEKSAIFIDNAFSERKDVSETLKIPVFDVDAISTLIDWKY